MTARSASRRYIRIRVAIWSLRDRPARRRPPSSGPIRSTSPRSRAPWTSSSVADGANAPDATSASSCVQAGDHSGELVVGEQVGPMESSGVGPRAGEVVRREPPVEVGGPAEGEHRLRRAAAEAAAPQPPGVGIVAHDGRPASRRAAILLDSPYNSMKPRA